MLSATTKNVVDDARLFRWIGRFSGVALFFIWLTLFVAEAVGPGIHQPSITTTGQLVALIVVFLGYAIGWRAELIGGILSIVGTLAFFVVVRIATLVPPGLEAATFAAPGVFYLLSWVSHAKEATEVRST